MSVFTIHLSMLTNMIISAESSGIALPDQVSRLMMHRFRQWNTFRQEVFETVLKFSANLKHLSSEANECAARAIYFFDLLYFLPRWPSHR